MTLHHLDLYQETPVPRLGSNYPSWYWTGHYTTWIHTRKHQFPARVQTTLPGIGRDATPPGIFPGTVGSPRIRATTSLVFLQDRHTTWNKSPAEGERSPLTPPAPFHFSSMDYKEKYRSRWHLSTRFQLVLARTPLHHPDGV